MNHLYNVIEADPPWTYRVWSDTGQKRNVSAKYDLMTNQDIIDLGRWIKPIMAVDCTLFLWVTWPLLPVGLEVGKAWGFEYKTCAMDWIKTTRGGDKWHWGMGHYTRANSEPCLLFTKGSPKRVDKGVHQIVSDCAPLDFIYHEALVSPVMAHSRKPETVYDRIERLLGEQSRLRLFARDERPGWTSLGNEVTGNDIRTDLARMAAPSFWAGKRFAEVSHA